MFTKMLIRTLPLKYHESFQLKSSNLQTNLNPLLNSSRNYLNPFQETQFKLSLKEFHFAITNKKKNSDDIIIILIFRLKNFCIWKKIHFFYSKADELILGWKQKLLLYCWRNFAKSDFPHCSSSLTDISIQLWIHLIHSFAYFSVHE